MASSDEDDDDESFLASNLVWSGVFVFFVRTVMGAVNASDSRAGVCAARKRRAEMMDFRQRIALEVVIIADRKATMRYAVCCILSLPPLDSFCDCRRRQLKSYASQLM